MNNDYVVEARRFWVLAGQDAVRCHFEEDEQPTLVRLHVGREEVLLV